MIAEIILTKLVEYSFANLNSLLSSIKGKMNSKEEDIYNSINYHLEDVAKWSNMLSFKDIKDPKITTKIFVDLNLHLTPRRLMFENEKCVSFNMHDIFNVSTDHIVLLGQPGAGKTTSMRYICQKILQDDSFFSEMFNFPILIKLRELNSQSIYTTIFSRLKTILGLDIEFTNDKINSDTKADYERKTIVKLLENMHILLILDGFDEIASSEFSEIILSEIRYLSLNLTHSRLILTSRSSVFYYSIENTRVYELCPLSLEQINNFAIKWLQDEKQASDFVKQIERSPFFDTAIRPLTLSHLAAIYERIHRIPEKPKTVYKKIVNLLLAEWDEQRSVKRTSGYADFEPDRKSEFLHALAYHITILLNSSTFNKANLQWVYGQIYDNFGLGKYEAENVADELETHTGLFVKSGYEYYEFAHKSIQEYLSAEYIVKLPSIPNDPKYFEYLANEFAISVSISSNPSNYFSELVINRINRIKISDNFIFAFINRLLLEKPEFNHSPVSIIALLTLYSIFYRREKTMKERNDFNDFSKLHVNFEVFIALITKRNSFKTIYDLYDIVDKDAEKHVKFKRNNKKFKQSLPPILYCKKDFIQN